MQHSTSLNVLHTPALKVVTSSVALVYTIVNVLEVKVIVD